MQNTNFYQKKKSGHLLKEETAHFFVNKIREKF